MSYNVYVSIFSCYVWDNINLIVGEWVNIIEINIVNGIFDVFEVD